MRLEILHTAATYPPCVDGVSHVVQTISEKLASRGHRVIVATGQHPQRNFQQLNGVEIREFDILGNQALGYTGNTQPYIEFIGSFAGDVMMNYAGQIWTSDLVFPLLDELNCIRVFTPCGYPGLNDPKYGTYFETIPKVMNKYDHIIYHSGIYQDKLFGDQHDVQQYSIIPNGSLEEEFLMKREGFRETYGIRSARMFLCVGNYSVQKGQEMVLRAYLEASVPDSTLVFIGTSFNKYAWENLRKKPSTKGLASAAFKGRTMVRRHVWNRIFTAPHSLRGPSPPGLDVRLFEKIPREMLVAAYHEADLFIYGSQVECFPLVILEAMASSSPFISTDCGNVRELPGGVVVTSVDNMAEMIHELAMKGHDWHRLAEAGRRAGEKEYRGGGSGVQDERLYLSLSAKRKLVM